MATATLTSLLTDIDVDGTGNPTKFGGGNSPSVDTDMFTQGVRCYSCGMSGGIGAASPTMADFSGSYKAFTSHDFAGEHLHIAIRCLYRAFEAGGIGVLLGDGTNFGEWKIEGASYGGGWLYAVLNCDHTTGTPVVAPDYNDGAAPDMSAITQIGMVINNSTDKGEAFIQNNYWDAVRRTTTGGNNGIRVTGGTTGDRLLLSDISAADGDATRYSIFQKGNILQGELYLGFSASTIYLQDSLQTVIFKDFIPTLDSTYYRVIGNDATTGVTNIDLTDIVWKGVSVAVPFDFDMSGLGTGDTGIFLRNTWVFGNLLKFNSLNTVDGCTFSECSDINPNGITFTECSFNNSDALTLTVANDKVSGGATNTHNTLINVAFMTTNDATKIENHAFDNTGGVGHAIEITAIGSWNFTGNTFSGYGADETSSSAIYNNSGGAVTLTILGGGGTPTVRNGTSATTTIVAGAVTTTVNAVTTTGAAITGAVIQLRPSDNTGDLPYQESVTITRVTTTATVAHTAHNLASNDWVIISGAVQSEYNQMRQVTVVDANSYTYTVSGTPLSPATGTIIATAVLIYGTTTGTGTLSDTRTFSVDQPVTGYARKSTATPLYQQAPINGIVSSTSGATFNAVLVDDEG